MVASASPFLPVLPDADTPIPPERPFALGSAPGPGRTAAKLTTLNVAAAAAPAAPAPAAPAPERSVVKLASVHTQKLPDLDSAPRTDARPVATYAPVQNDGVLGLMSGRGLY